MPTTPVYALRYPASSDPADVPTDMGELAADVEAAVGALNAAGPYLSRPTAAAAKNGGVYYATDTLGTFRSDGTNWTLIQQGAPSITSAAMSAAPFTTPYDGQMIDLLVDTSLGVIWRLKYRSAEVSANKWEFVGGPALASYMPTSETFTAVGSWTNTATPGPIVTIPRAGDYHIRWGATLSKTAADGGVGVGFGIGDFTGQIQEIYGRFDTSIGGYASPAGASVVSATAGQVLRVKYYQSTAGSTSVSYRSLAITPTRVS